MFGQQKAHMETFTRPMQYLKGFREGWRTHTTLSSKAHLPDEDHVEVSKVETDAFQIDQVDLCMRG